MFTVTGNDVYIVDKPVTTVYTLVAFVLVSASRFQVVLNNNLCCKVYRVT